nr:MAG TPA: hypothetical protein [Microviridae sp.]
MHVMCEAFFIFRVCDLSGRFASFPLMSIYCGHSTSVLCRLQGK